MENQYNSNQDNNQNVAPDVTEIQPMAQAPEQAVPQSKTNSRHWLVAAFVGIMVLGFGVLGYTGNQQLYKAEITAPTEPANVSNLYVPNYNAAAGDTGTVDLKSKEGFLEGLEIDFISFKITYSPADALVFDQGDELVMDSGTIFSATQQIFPITLSDIPGQVTITGISDTPVLLGADDTLFRIPLTISENAPTDTPITMTITEVSAANGSTPVDVGSIIAGSLTLGTASNLKVDYAEAIDETHVVVYFSDILTSAGDTTNFSQDPITVSGSELGSDYGYGQRSVYLTTDTQETGVKYVIEIDQINEEEAENVESNQQGLINGNYDSVVFYGYGAETVAASSFSAESAEAINYNQFTVTFSEDVDAGSIVTTDFTIDNELEIASIDPVTNEANKLLFTLVDSDNLLASNNYLLTIAGSNSLESTTDNPLAINMVSFVGYANGPKLIDANSRDGVIVLSFSEDINVSDTNPIGHLFPTTGDNTVPTTISVLEDLYAVNGSSIVLSGITFGDNINYTFIATSDSITNIEGLSLDTSFDQISVWAYEETPEELLGDAAVSKVREFTVEAGTFPTNQVDAADVKLFTYELEGPTAVVPTEVDTVEVTSVTLDDENNLKVTTDEDLEIGEHYVFLINGLEDAILHVGEFVLEPGLDVVNATALSSNQIEIEFSESVNRETLTLADFNGVNAIDNTDSYSKFVLTINGTMNAGAVMGGAFIDEADVRSFVGAKPLRNKGSYFIGYQSEASLVKLSTVNSVSPTQVELTFSGGDLLDTEDNLSAAKLKIVSSENLSDFSSPLTIPTEGGVTMGSDNHSLVVNTANQTPGKQYFVLMEGLQDIEGQAISNTKVLSFLGYSVPAANVTSATPGSIVLDETEQINLVGQNLDTVTTVKIGTLEVSFVTDSATQINIPIPVDFSLTSGTYDITLVNSVDQVFTFSNLVTVVSEVVPMSLDATRSYTIPSSVAPGGSVVFWVLISDPGDIAAARTVTMDLSSIQVAGTDTEFTVSDVTPPVNGSKWYVSNTITVPANVQPQTEAYLIPVTVNKNGDVSTGSIPLNITYDLITGNAPTVESAYATPTPVVPDGESEVTISAKIRDEDGAATIMSVQAEFDPALGLAPVVLQPLGATTTPATVPLGDDADSGTTILTDSGQKTGWYTLSGLVIPKNQNLVDGDYPVTVTVIDNTGEEGTFEFNITVSKASDGPSIDSSRSYLTPRSSIPNDDTTPFAINLYVHDPDGVGDIQSVTADFASLKLPPVELLKNADTSDDALYAWFIADGITIPKTSPTGLHTIHVSATDSSNTTTDMTISIDVTSKDNIGEPPRVLSDKSYTTPRVAMNNGKTPIMLYAFVRDDDNDIESVLVDLHDIGQVGPEPVSAFAEAHSEDGTTPETDPATEDPVGTDEDSEDSSGTCPTASKTLVCMNPSVKEGMLGQWFILPDVTVSKLTAPSSEAYMVPVIVTDSAGKTARGTVPVYVYDGDNFTNDRNPPEMVVSVATGANTVEVLFNEELMASSVSKSGFQVVDRDNVKNVISVTDVTTNVAGTIVTLSTASTLDADTDYVVVGNNTVKDALGVALVPGSTNRLPLRGYVDESKSPVVEYIASTDADTIEVEFRDYLKPSSLKLAPVTADQESINEGTRGGNQFNFEIVESGGTSATLEVLGVKFLDEPNVIEVKTAPQKSGQRYRIRIKDVESYTGDATRVPLNKMVKGFKQSAVSLGSANGGNLGDLNGDGKVDFIDFTIFSSLYGMMYGSANAPSAPAPSVGDLPTPSGPTAQGSTPDSILPHTSTPDGGDVSDSDLVTLPTNQAIPVQD